MIHEIAGQNFHGSYRITLRGPKAGFVLSPGQEAKVRRELCPHSTCECGGSLRYGNGPDPETARVFVEYGAQVELLPAGAAPPEWYDGEKFVIA